MDYRVFIGEHMDEETKKQLKCSWHVTLLNVYFIWYAFIVYQYFQMNLLIWVNATFMALLIGFALNANARMNNRRVDWATQVRFYLFPFCVSSYSALAKGGDFFFIFPYDFQQSLLGLGIAVGGALGCTWLLNLYRYATYKKTHAALE